MVNHRLLTTDMKNDMTFTSMYNKLGLYINHYPNGVSLHAAQSNSRCYTDSTGSYKPFSSVQVVTVNCARIINANQVARNGVVHVIDRVISSVGNTIKDYLESDEDLATFTVCKILFENNSNPHNELLKPVLSAKYPTCCHLFCSQDSAFASGVMDRLGEPGHYTLFVPTNKAFEKLSPGYMESITENQAVVTGIKKITAYYLFNYLSLFCITFGNLLSSTNAIKKVPIKIPPELSNCQQNGH